MEKWEKSFIEKSSVPLPDGGDTHIHPFGPETTDFVVTTRLPNGVEIHDEGKDFFNK